jgi:hypothetical protein
LGEEVHAPRNELLVLATERTLVIRLECVAMFVDVLKYTGTADALESSLRAYRSRVVNRELSPRAAFAAKAKPGPILAET